MLVFVVIVAIAIGVDTIVITFVETSVVFVGKRVQITEVLVYQVVDLFLLKLLIGRKVLRVLQQLPHQLLGRSNLRVKFIVRDLDT